jgi:hypothetical protein
LSWKTLRCHNFLWVAMGRSHATVPHLLLPSSSPEDCLQK